MDLRESGGSRWWFGISCTKSHDQFFVDRLWSFTQCHVLRDLRHTVTHLCEMLTSELNQITTIIYIYITEDQTRIREYKETFVSISSHLRQCPRDGDKRFGGIGF